jgi:hypothetical protein
MTEQVYQATKGTTILEEGDEALLEAPKDEPGVEYADLSSLTEPSLAGKQQVADKSAAKPAVADTKPAAPVKTEQVDDMPAEFKGKTPGQLARMYKEAQALIGRQGQELGEVRRLADSVIKAQLAAASAAKAAPASKPADATDENPDAAFFAKPSEAIQKAIENSPLVKQLRDTLGQVEADRAVSRMQAAKTRFDTDHPDAGQIMDDPEFVAWVKSSPIRTALIKRADEKYDYLAGNEIFSTWKALKGTQKPADADPTADADAAAASQAAAALAKRKAQLKAAGVPGGGGGGAADGKGPVYRRSQILKLMEENPDEYLRLAPEIEKAYREKRVR